MISILDYGLGNLRSVEKAIVALGARCEVGTEFKTAEKLIIPGVGAFGAAMEKIGPLKQQILDFAATGRPVFGICLGQQLLFDESEELGTYSGLGLIPGKVRYLPRDSGLKIPHFGWSSLTYHRHTAVGLDGVDGEQVYFVHSLYTDCAESADIVATAEYGIEFPAAVQRGNIWGTQFHPEKSSEIGLRMLKNFIEC